MWSGSLVGFEDSGESEAIDNDHADSRTVDLNSFPQANAGNLLATGTNWLPAPISKLLKQVSMIIEDASYATFVESAAMVRGKV